MNLLLKERVKDIKEEQRQCEYELEMALQKVNMQKKNIENLEEVDQKHTAIAENKFKSNEERIKEIKLKIKSFDKEIDQITPKILQLDKSIARHEKYKVMRTKIHSRKENATKDIKFFEENDNCPVCTQTIDSDLKTEKIGSLSSKVEEFKIAHSQITEHICSLSDEVKELRSQAEVVNGYRYEIQSLTKEEMKLLKENTAIMTDIGSDSSSLEEERQDLVQFEHKLHEKEVFCANVNKQSDNLKTVTNLLKDGGIKTKIVSKFIPIINQKINKYLTSMDFYVNFTLDENFNEKILSRFRDDFSYASFSEGEKQKIDLALLFTWREIAKMKNSASTNLLILDEVFDSSLDQGSTDELMKILRGLGRDVNLYVISHKGDILLDKFDRLVSFEKQSDFSLMKIHEGS